jgi:hypothetical protein
MKESGAKSVMPYPVQILCLEWFQLKYGISIPVCVVDDSNCDKNQICDLLDGRFLVRKVDQVSGLKGGRFLLWYQQARAVCCRIIASRHGGEICLVMDTQRADSPLKSLQLLENLYACKELPMVLRRAQLDLLCSQENPSCREPLAMSLGNYITDDDDSITAEQAQQIHREFVEDAGISFQGMFKKHQLPLKWILHHP